VTVGACVVTSFDTTAITEADYTVNTGDQDISFVGFTQTPSCAYSVTYTAFDTTGDTDIELDGNQIIQLADSKFVINTSDPDDVDTYEIKLVGTLDDSPTTSSEVSFTQVVVANCPEDQVSLTTGISDTTYYINKPKVTFTAVFEHTYVDCPLSFELFEDDGAVSANWIEGFDTTTGVITVSTVDFSFNLNSAELKVVATSTDSTDAAAKTAETSFTLTLKDKCEDAVLSPPTITTTDYTWDLWAQQTMPFNAMSDDSDAIDGCSQYVYEIVDVTEVYSAFGEIVDLNVKNDLSKN